MMFRHPGFRSDSYAFDTNRMVVEAVWVEGLLGVMVSQQNYHFQGSGGSSIS